MYDEKTMIEVFEDDYPIEPSGITRADEIARGIGATGIDKDHYENVFIKIMKHIPSNGWSFLVKFMSFVRDAKFQKSFYEAFASFIKEGVWEIPATDTTPMSRTFLSGHCIVFIASNFKELFDLQWINETYVDLTSDYPFIYLDLIKIYEPQNFLIEIDGVLKILHKKDKDLSTEILNYSLLLTELFSKEEITPYFESWKAFIPKNKQKQYADIVQYYLNKDQVVK